MFVVFVGVGLVVGEEGRDFDGDGEGEERLAELGPVHGEEGL